MSNPAAAARRRMALRQGLALFLTVTVLFVVLYFPCIFQGKMYGYQDIGRDTQNQYLPNMVFALRSFRTGDVDAYRLDRGLGEYYPSLLYKYVNGVNLPLLVFGEKNLAWGLLASTYLKYLVIALFSWLFFRRLFGRGLIPVCCAIAWTYCGYSVGWGQHYHLLTSICAFTIEIYGLQRFLESDRKAFLLIPAAACMTYTGYFYLWMGSFFVLGYSLCYMIFRGEKPLTILKKALLCILCFVWAGFIGGEYMFPGVGEFIESTRGGNIANSGEAGSLLFYDSSYLYAFVARLLSPNLLGIGNGYKGPTNYYEIAYAGVGILFIFAVSALLLNRRTRARTAGLLVICGLLTCSPLASKLFSMRATTQRWSFILQLAEIIGIGFGLKQLCEARDMEGLRKDVLNALLLTDVVCCALVVALWLGQAKANVAVSGDALLWFFVLLAAYNVVLIATMQYLPAWTCSLADFKRVAVAAVALLACAEIIAADYPAINDRELLTREGWRREMYYDGTELAAGWIKAQDDGLYRVSKTYESVSRNDEEVQGFNGVAVYNSLNAHWLVNYYAQMGYDISNSSTATGSNYIRFLCRDEAEAGLLGVRYVIAKADDDATPLPVPGSAEGHPVRNTDLTVYKNDVVSSFGYFYDARLDYDEIARCGGDYAKLQMTRGYFPTVDLLSGASGEGEAAEGGDGGFEEDALPADHPEVGLFVKELLTEPYRDQSCVIEGPELPGSILPLRAHVTVNAPEDANLRIVFVSGSGEDAVHENSGQIGISKGQGTYAADIRQARDIQAIRIVADKPVWYESVALEYMDRDVVAENVRRLYGNGSVDISQQGNCFSGTVNNPADEARMLCVPLVFSGHWQARVDGAEAEAQNINGGLVGLEIGPGAHTVELTYRDRLPQLGRLAGAVSFGLYLLALAVYRVVRRRRERAGETRV